MTILSYQQETNIVNCGDIDYFYSVKPNTTNTSTTMNIGSNIKKIREDREIKQAEIADLIGMHRSNYSKIENGQREISLAAIDKIATFFNISIDELVHLGNDIPKEISMEDKTTSEQVKLIQELDQEEKNIVFKMIETFLTKKKFKDFFNKNIAAL